MSNIQLVLLAGGYGKRMSPLTLDYPKSLLKINGSNTVLDYQLKQFSQQNIENIVILTGYKDSMIKDYLQQKRWVTNLKIIPSMNGTGGSLKAVLELLDEDFIYQYGDVHININYDLLFLYHETNSPYKMTMTVYPRRNLQHDPNNVDYEDDHVTYYGKGGCTHKAIDAGVMVINKKVIENVKNKVWDLSDIIPELVKEKQVKAYVSKSEPLEVGSFEGLNKFKEKIRGEI